MLLTENFISELGLIIDIIDKCSSKAEISSHIETANENIDLLLKELSRINKTKIKSLTKVKQDNNIINKDNVINKSKYTKEEVLNIIKGHNRDVTEICNVYSKYIVKKN